LEQQGKTIAAVPLYLKQHSWGEYVFDHSWADAYHNHGIPYYPKLITAIPFTPATGPRLGIASQVNAEELIPELLEIIKNLASEWGASGWHMLFPEPQLAMSLESNGAMQRTGVQYHWHNKNYDSFDDFLHTFSSRKRKNILKERRSAGQLLQIKRLVGKEITSDWWDFFHIMYQRTYLKRSGTGGYLTEEFFKQLGDVMGNQVMMSVAETGAENNTTSKVAAALFFFDKQTLYGRYWGCQHEYDFLHFELCYYQGIEFAIEQEISRFDAGAQGEHKIKRGFKPVETYSTHWIRDPDFSTAIHHFLAQETPQVKEYITQASKQLPYKVENK
jgi:predicted N-acyltransferase